MGLLKCKDCGRAVSSQAKACPVCGAPVPAMSRHLPAHEVVILLIVGAAAIWYMASREKPSSPSKPSATREEQPRRDERIAVFGFSADLVQEYAANEVRADGRYKGKILAITGTVDTVGKDILNTPYVTLKGSSDGFRSVQCFFGKAGEPELAMLRTGGTITIRGRCAGLMMNVLLKDCAVHTPGR